MFGAGSDIYMIFFISEYDGLYRIALFANGAIMQEAANKKRLTWFSVHDGYLVFSDGFLFPLTEEVAKKIHDANEGDVFEFDSTGKAYRCYDYCSNDNTLFVTNRCNCNCVMCPMPESLRKNGNGYSAEQLLTLIDYYPSDSEHITITGGEPFLLKAELFKVLAKLRDNLPKTDYLLLTNGRAFSIDNYAQQMKMNSPEKMLVGIPIHGSTEKTHDAIMQSPGSFSQTLAGINNLLGYGLNVEIRLVINRLNADELLGIAKLIVQEFSSVHCVKMMAMEMTGSAAINKEAVWIPYPEAFHVCRDAIDYLVEHGIDVGLYNFPLCCVDSRYWAICEKSISDYKVRFDQECDGCSVKDACGGVFAGTIRLVKNDLSAV